MASEPIGERIICAANLLNTGQIVLGVRHFDRNMVEMASLVPGYQDVVEQGFLTNHNRFVSRKLAHKIATQAGQIIRRCGGDEDTLYSENLY